MMPRGTYRKPCRRSRSGVPPLPADFEERIKRPEFKRGVNSVIDALLADGRREMELVDAIMVYIAALLLADEEGFVEDNCEMVARFMNSHLEALRRALFPILLERPDFQDEQRRRAEAGGIGQMESLQ